MNTGPLDILSALGDAGASPALTEIAKALTTMGAGTDLSALSGGGAFRIENMDPVLASATVQQQHFKFFKRLLPNRREAWSVLDQAVVKTGIGAFFGSANSNELGSGQEERTGEYTRVITELGTYFSRRSVSIITALQATLQNKNGIVDFSAVDEEDVNAALEILWSLEYDLFLGDKLQNPFGTTGIIPAVLSGAPDNVVDLRGEALTSHVPISILANKITDGENWGKPELLFCSGKVKADLDNKLEAGYRVNLDERIPNVDTGVLVKGMRYSSVGLADGTIEFDPSAFLNENKSPIHATKPSLCTGSAPLAVVATQSVGATSGSKWLDKTTGAYQYTVAGAYAWAVEAYTPGKVSASVISNSITMVAGRSCAIAITASASNLETHYKVYRCAKGGAQTEANMRLIGIIKKDVSGTTTFTDLNENIPGSSYAVVLTMQPSSLRWVQMLPMTKIPFALNDLSYKWGAFVVGALRTALPKHHGVVKNIVPTGADWLPFGTTNASNILGYIAGGTGATGGTGPTGPTGPTA